MTLYLIRIPCAPSDTLAAAVPEMTVTAAGKGALLMGELRDHTDVQGVLARLSDMGLEVDEFRKLD